MIFIGKCSTFGGPDDTGVTPTEGLGLISTVQERNKHLFVAGCEIGERALARALSPEAYYIAMRWPFGRLKIAGKYQLWPMATCSIDEEVAYWSQFRGLIRNPTNGKVCMWEAVDSGPARWTKRIVDCSPGINKYLGVKTDDTVEVMFLGTRYEWKLVGNDLASRIWNQWKTSKEATNALAGSTRG